MIPVVPVIDLHCDLLAYLEKSPQRTSNDPESRCSIPQMQEGGVKLQTLAIFTTTDKDSLKSAANQLKLYQNLPVYHPKEIRQLKNISEWSPNPSQITTMFAFENASGFCDEVESLERGINRFENIIEMHGKPVYVGMTWNSENRFGGGVLSNVGLKEEGKVLLEKMNDHQIPIDLSHASDHLAYDILDFIENRTLTLPVLASHSNSRDCGNVPRNLPNDIAKEIFRKKGVIGMNLYSKFIGSNEENLFKHFEHWLEMGGENHLCFGADFFCTKDTTPNASYSWSNGGFFDTYGNASCYQKLLQSLNKEVGLTPLQVEKIANKNLASFLMNSTAY